MSKQIIRDILWQRERGQIKFENVFMAISSDLRYSLCCTLFKLAQFLYNYQRITE